MQLKLKELLTILVIPLSLMGCSTTAGFVTDKSWCARYPIQKGSRNSLPEDLKMFFIFNKKREHDCKNNNYKK